MNVPYDLMIQIISSSPECVDYLTRKYSYEYEVWIRFSSRNGPGCPLARAAIRRIFAFEYAYHKEEFLGSLGSGVWGSKEYQNEKTD